MNFTVFESDGLVCVHRECIARHAFKEAAIGDNYARCPVMCAGAFHTGDSYAHLRRIERLSPCTSAV